MSRPSKAIPGLAVGDTVWLLPYETGGTPRKGRVRRVYKSTPEASVDVLDARGRRLFTVSAHGPDEGTRWWRSEADALDAVRKSRRAHLVRNREQTQRQLRQLLEDRAVAMRRSEDYEARINAQLAEFDAALAALDAEVQS